MLPKQNSIRYELTIPSTGKVHKYRPFTVKEEKALLIAQQSEDIDTMVATLRKIIQDCLEPTVNPDDLANFDLEYIMIMLRTKSVGEKVRLEFQCGQCASKEPIVTDLDLTKVEVITNSEHTRLIPLFDDVGVMMKYPSIKQMDDMVALEQDEMKVFDLIIGCIDYVYDKEEIFHAHEQTKEELVEFIEGLTKDTFKKIANFFLTMPKVQHTAEFKCDACGFEHKRMVRGFSNFF